MPLLHEAFEPLLAINFSLLQFIKTIISTLFICSALISLGQDKVDTTRLLELNQAKNYKEGNYFWRDSFITVLQELAYNDPKIIDEEFSQYLTIRFLQKPYLENNKSFDVVKDSNLIKCSYDQISVWRWSEKKTLISGQVKVISTKRRTIELEFNLTVTEPGKGIYLYRGIRRFKKSTPVIKYSHRLDAGNT
ncbi:MAG TPA: hypothetical protein VNS32_12980 [Flavisolibacter sp.]|nr:hypothetical protein [Flavisolibacter sp.]